MLGKIFLDWLRLYVVIGLSLSLPPSPPPKQQMYQSKRVLSMKIFKIRNQYGKSGWHITKAPSPFVKPVYHCKQKLDNCFLVRLKNTALILLLWISSCLKNPRVWLHSLVRRTFRYSKLIHRYNWIVEANACDLKLALCSCTILCFQFSISLNCR